MNSGHDASEFVEFFVIVEYKLQFSCDIWLNLNDRSGLEFVVKFR